MRHQYTPIFRDVLTSRVWALSHATVRVWLWLKVSADPEGFVCTSLAGVAVGARVTLDEARVAVEELEAMDLDAHEDDPHEGRVILRVPRGWQVLGVEAERELAKHESYKARQRKYMVSYRAAQKATADSPAPANDAPVTANEPVVDSPKPTPKPKPSPQEGRSPLPPVGDISRYEGDAYSAVFVDPGSYEVAPAVIRRIPHGVQLAPEQREEARLAGVERVDEHFARLKTGPIGGSRGVFAADLSGYIRGMFGKWRTWEETDRAKAKAAAERPAGVRSFQAPAWEPNGRHRAYAQKRGLDIGALVAAFTARNYTREHYPEKELNEKFGQFMAAAAKGVAA
jgi:hypothetical protein